MAISYLRTSRADSASMDIDRTFFRFSFLLFLVCNAKMSADRGRVICEGIYTRNNPGEKSRIFRAPRHGGVIISSDEALQLSASFPTGKELSSSEEDPEEIGEGEWR